MKPAKSFGRDRPILLIIVSIAEVAVMIIMAQNTRPCQEKLQAAESWADKSLSCDRLLNWLRGIVLP